jgi:Tetracyclin repressor-like, C-terminal domain
MNAETIDIFRARCEKVDFSKGPAASLRQLVEVYIAYNQRNRRLWNAIFDHKLPAGYQRQEVYLVAVRRLVDVVEGAIAPLFKPNQNAARRHDANLLWSSLYGIASLSASQRLAKDETVLGLIDTLIEIYISARQKKSPKSKRRA